jgi:hypothetical protein
LNLLLGHKEAAASFAWTVLREWQLSHWHKGWSTEEKHSAGGQVLSVES